MYQIKFALCFLVASSVSSAGLPLERRNKRSTAPFGLTVLRTLLKDAKVISVTDSKLAFVKPGGYSQALRDFGALKPDKVDELTAKLDNGVVLTHGLVGDKGIQLVQGNAMHETMLSIFKVGDTDNRLVILYPDDMPLGF